MPASGSRATMMCTLAPPLATSAGLGPGPPGLAAGWRVIHLLFNSEARVIHLLFNFEASAWAGSSATSVITARVSSRASGEPIVAVTAEAATVIAVTAEAITVSADTHTASGRQMRVEQSTPAESNRF